MHASISAARVRWVLVTGLAILGLAVEIALASSPQYRSRAIVLMPPGTTHTGRFFDAASVTSRPVLAEAARHPGNRVTIGRDRISVTLPVRAERHGIAAGRLAIEITATGATRNSAKGAVTAVATGYIQFITKRRTPLGHIPIRNVVMLGPPAPLPRGSWLRAAVRPGALGLLSGLALGLLLLLIPGKGPVDPGGRRTS